MTLADPKALAERASKGPFKSFPHYSGTPEMFLVGVGQFETIADVRRGDGDIEGDMEATAALLAFSANLVRKLLSDEGVEIMARAIYEQNPIYEQPVDADLRPIGAGGEITFDQLYDYDAGLYANVRDQARAAINAIIEASDV